MRIRARAPGKVVALGEYAVLDGEPALVLAVDRYVTATLERSADADCRLLTRMPEPSERRFARGEPSGVPLVDLLTSSSNVAPAWQGALDSGAFYDGPSKLGFGSSAAATCAWAGAWTAYLRATTSPECPEPSLDALIAMHRRFQGGRGSGIDVAASLCGGAVEFRVEASGAPRVGSVRLPNSVGFAGIFAGRSASTPGLVAHYRAWAEAHPADAARRVHRLGSIAAAGLTAARGNAASAFVEAIADYGRGLQDLGAAIGADIVTSEHLAIGEQARRYGVAYKVSGAGGGDLGLACALDAEALEAFKTSVRLRGFRVIDIGLAERGLSVGRDGEQV